MELKERLRFDPTRLTRSVAPHQEDQCGTPAVPLQRAVEAGEAQQHPERVDQDRAKAEHQVFLREHEVVVHHRIRQRDVRQAGERAAVQAIWPQGGAGAVVDSEIEQFAGRRIDLRVGGERPDLAAEVLHAEGRERGRIERVRGTAFPQRQELLLLQHHRGVGDVGWLPERVGDDAARPHLAEAAMDDAAGPRLISVVLGADVSIEVTNARVVEPDRRDHPVAVEPMSEPMAAEVVPARTVAEQRATQRCRHPAVDLVDPVIVLAGQAAKSRAPRVIGAGGSVGAVRGMRHGRRLRLVTPPRWSAADADVRHARRERISIGA